MTERENPGWQPIEAARKDGTLIVVRRKRRAEDADSEIEVVEARWGVFKCKMTGRHRMDWHMPDGTQIAAVEWNPTLTEQRASAAANAAAP